MVTPGNRAHNVPKKPSHEPGPIRELPLPNERIHRDLLQAEHAKHRTRDFFMSALSLAVEAAIYGHLCDAQPSERSW